MSLVLRLSNVSLERGGNAIVNNVSWEVTSDQRWVILGPNGAGKTSILELAAAWEIPTSGTAVVLGEDLATGDPEEIRPRVGLASSGMAKRIPSTETVVDAVVTAAYAAAERRGEVYDDIDLRRARRVLAEWRLEDFTNREIGTLSEGEQKRLQIARSIMTDPEVLLLDEPSAGLDLGMREELMSMLSAFASSPTAPAIIMVTHHVEEIPRGFTHVLLMANGRVSAQGPLNETLTSENLTRAFGVSVEVANNNGRFSATAMPSAGLPV
ncbi:MAG: ATP-binding cassette domain-containing protein [Actinomycetales bacterium]|nr:ATP-binding cassette domain-containing protein [Actinomycetales bacterium]